MINPSRMISGIAATLVAGSIAMGAAGVQAGVIQLGFVLDESGSIGSDNFTTIKNGLSAAINLIPADSKYEITVVSFDSTATTVVDTVLIDSEATRMSVAMTVANAGYGGGGTAIDAGLVLMNTLLKASTEMIDFSYVNLMTDGISTQSTAITARNTLIDENEAGVDNISIETIGDSVQASFLQDSICYPAPCDLTSPYNFPDQGFYINVPDADAYADAIGTKVLVVTEQPLPEPGTLALFGLGLVGLALARRRRAA